MKKLNKCLAAGIAALGITAACFSTPAIAAPQDDGYAGCPMYMMGGGPGPGYCYGDHDGAYRGHHQRWQEYRQQRRTAMQERLKLNAQQQKAWTDYMAVTDKNFNSWKPFSRTDLEKMTAPQRLEAMIGRMQERQQAMSTQLTALKTFYSQLTPEQQKIFDSESMYAPRFHRGGPMMR